MTKSARQFAIKEIIAALPIGTQEELRRELGEARVPRHAGHAVA